MNKKINNILMDTTFENYKSFWEVKNCRTRKNKKGLILKSNNKLFSLIQNVELVKGRYYFRVKVKPLTFVEKISIGISQNDEMTMVGDYGSVNTEKTLSIMVDIKKKTNNTKVHIVCETKNGGNIEIREPLLVNTTKEHVSTKLKKYLDNNINYVEGTTYKNALGVDSFTKLGFENGFWKLKTDGSSTIEWDKETGLITTTKDSVVVYYEPDLKANHLYLLKINVTGLNGVGVCEFKFNKKTKVIENKQGQYFIKRNAEKTNIIEFVFKSDKMGIPMVFYIKDILLVDLSKSKMENIDEKEIIRLPYIK